MFFTIFISIVFICTISFFTFPILARTQCWVGLAQFFSIKPNLTLCMEVGHNDCIWLDPDRHTKSATVVIVLNWSLSQYGWEAMVVNYARLSGDNSIYDDGPITKTSFFVVLREQLMYIYFCIILFLSLLSVYVHKLINDDDRSVHT